MLMAMLYLIWQCFFVHLHVNFETIVLSGTFAKTIVQGGRLY